MHMLQDELVKERETNIQQLIDKLEEILRSYIKQEDQLIIDNLEKFNTEQKAEIKKTHTYIQEVNSTVEDHQQKFLKDEEEPVILTPE